MVYSTVENKVKNKLHRKSIDLTHSVHKYYRNKYFQSFKSAKKRDISVEKVVLNRYLNTWKVINLLCILFVSHGQLLLVCRLVVSLYAGYVI